MPAGAIVLLQDGSVLLPRDEVLRRAAARRRAIFFFDAAGGTWINVTRHRDPVRGGQA